MPGCLPLFRKWRGFLPYQASGERESRKTATPPHDGSPPMKGSSSWKTFPSGIEELHKPDNSTVEYVLSYISDHS